VPPGDSQDAGAVGVGVHVLIEPWVTSHVHCKVPGVVPVPVRDRVVKGYAGGATNTSSAQRWVGGDGIRRSDVLSFPRLREPS